MHSFAHRGDHESLKELFDVPRNQVLLDISAPDANGDTVLHTSARLGNFPLVQLALALGGDPFIKNRKGKIPLEVCKEEAIKILLKEAPMVNTSETTIQGKKTRVEGFLGKWTNYAEGYRRRWFVLEDGILSYYKSQVDYPVSCRGSLNLQFAQVLPHSHDRLRFEVIGVNSTMRYHLRADNAADAKRWIIAVNQAQMALSTEVSPKTTGIPIVGAGTGSPETMFHLAGCEYEKSGKELIGGLFTNMDSLEVLFAQLTEGDVINDEAKMTIPLIIQKLKESFGSIEEREGLWRQKLETETQQRQLFEDSLRAVALENHKLELFTRKKLKNSPSSAQELDEFYDALESQSMMIESEDSEVEREASEEELSVAEKSVEGSFISKELVGYPKKFRSVLPADSTTMPPIHLWGIIKNMLGKDLFRIPLPVNFSEPVSMLQRLCEDMEYCELLDQAAAATDPVKKYILLAAFAVSGYSSTDGRVTKPFNPLLGETFEYVSREKGLRYIAEQVSHHPPISACHAETAEWTYYGNANVKNKFSGQSLELIPEGYTHVIFKRTGEHYYWKRVRTIIHNLIVGKLWIDHCGVMSIEKAGGDVLKCQVEFEKAGWTTSKNVHIKVLDTATNQEAASISGKWNEEFEQVWRRHHLPAASTHMYKFTSFTMTLNELSEELKSAVCPTDSRLRPDQRAMEEGRFDEANELKVKLEEKQRVARKMITEETEARWFKKGCDELTGAEAWVFTGEYWEARQGGSWERISEIFQLE